MDIPAFGRQASESPFKKGDWLGDFNGNGEPVKGNVQKY
jgi:hypothetical protein